MQNNNMVLAAAPVFGDRMVLQRGKKIAVWGTAGDGSLVTVELNGAAATAVAKDGTWKAELPPMDACAQAEMKISDDRGGSVVFHDVAIGEVWIAGGQSNMEMGMYADAEFETVRPTASNPNIRFYDYPHVSYEGQPEDEDYSDYGFWRKLTPEDLEYFSAAGYYFAEKLYASLNIPVGILGCNWGGSPAAAWTDESYLTGELACYLEDNREALEGLDLDEYTRKFKEERVRANDPEAKDRMRTMMKTPMLEPLKFDFPMGEINMKVYMNGPCSPFRACGLYHTMLEKIMPYTCAGVIWYQGEADVARAAIYDNMFGTMIRCWRDGWNDELPFLFVQLAPLNFFAVSDGKGFVPIREMQEKVSKTVPNAYMACIMDAGMQYDIHPKRKRPVGERLALLARGHVYGEDILCESPEAVSLEKKAGSLTVKFANAGSGLHVEGDQVNALELYVNDAPVDEFAGKVEGAELVISSDRITDGDSAEVRFAWVGFCDDNLYSSAGLPAKPFVLRV